MTTAAQEFEKNKTIAEDKKAQEAAAKTAKNGKKGKKAITPDEQYMKHALEISTMVLETAKADADAEQMAKILVGVSGYLKKMK